MTIEFQQLNYQMAGLVSRAPPQFSRYAIEFWQTFNITTQRAIQVFNLYEFVTGAKVDAESFKSNQNWLNAEGALRSALQIMKNYHFRLPVERVASWNPKNPTSYNYMYLWTAKTLFYFWRDRQQVDATFFSKVLISD